MIISVINEKGGSGKTTLAVNLAARLSKDGDNVLLLDADPQKSTEVFSNIRSQAELQPLFSNMSKTGIALGDEIKRLKNNFDSIVIDTGGRDSKEMRKAIINSNIIIIPVIPSQYDVVVMDSMLEIFSNAKEINENLFAFLLINRVSPNPFLTKDLENLKQYISKTTKNKGLQDFKVLESVIYERQAFKRAVGEGKSIDEFCQNNDKAFIEFENFYQELLKIAQKI